ncbi:MAG: hypothetical protein OQK45_01660 [Sulfurovum sp.]|nr:hypothetical protein [Sulfurovum sp.]
MKTKNKVFRSVLAIILGLLISVFLPLITNQLVRTLDAYPEGSPELAFIYRLAYVVVGSYIAAILAPNSPKRHAMIIGIAMLLLYAISLASVTSSAYFLDFPRWYFYGLLILVIPSAFLGGALHHRFHVKDKEYIQTKASNTYSGLQIVLFIVLAIAIWFILYSIIMTFGIYSGLCYWEFIPSSTCIKGTAIFSTIIDLIIIVIIFLYKRKQRNDKDDHKSDEDEYNEKLHFME